MNNQEENIVETNIAEEVPGLEWFKKVMETTTPEEWARRQRLSEDAEREREKTRKRDRIAELRTNWNAPRKQLQTVVSTEGRYARWWKCFNHLKEKLGTGFLVALYGGRGPGKTQMGVELMRFTTESLKSARYGTATELFLGASQYPRDGELSDKDVVEQLSKVRLLVIDEVDKRAESGREARLFYEVIDRRYRDGAVDTLLISNYNKEGLQSSLGDSIISRMNETGGMIECNWESFRQ